MPLVRRVPSLAAAGDPCLSRRTFPTGPASFVDVSECAHCAEIAGHGSRARTIGARKPPSPLRFPHVTRLTFQPGGLYRRWQCHHTPLNENGAICFGRKGMCGVPVAIVGIRAITMTMPPGCSVLLVARGVTVRWHDGSPGGEKGQT